MTSGYLLDTNILSELRRKAPDAGLMAWWDAAPEHLLYVSVLTLGEIRYGTARLSSAGGGPYYRILVRAVGGRGTVSYTETVVHF